MCNSCLEKFLESNYVDEHSIVRLSDNEADFPQYSPGVDGREKATVH